MSCVTSAAAQYSVFFVVVVFCYRQIGLDKFCLIPLHSHNDNYTLALALICVCVQVFLYTF